MNKHEFELLIFRLNDAFNGKGLTHGQAEILWPMVERLTQAEFKLGVDNTIANEKYAPTIASILSHCPQPSIQKPVERLRDCDSCTNGLVLAERYDSALNVTDNPYVFRCPNNCEASYRYKRYPKWTSEFRKRPDWEICYP